jgi:hypothetical protein
LGLIARASGDVSRLLQQRAAWQLSDAEVVEGVEAAYRLVTQAHAAALTLLGEADARGLAAEAGAPSTRAWLSGRLRVRPEDAKRDVTLARLIHSANATDGAADGTAADGGGDDAGDAGVVEGARLRNGLAAGDVTTAQAGVIATALGELPEDATVSTRVLAEQLLVDEAAFQPPAALARVGHRILERIDPDAADRKLAEQLAREEREATRLRSGTRWVDGHGSVCYKFRIPIGDDVHVHPILDALSAPEPAGDGIGDTDTRTPKQRYADGFVEAFRRLNLQADLPAKGGDRPRALINLPLDTLTTGLGHATLVDTGDQLSAATARRLCCDAQIIPIVLGGDSQILDVGRARRCVDGPLRVAVIARDRGCIHPGCTNPPRWCDVHHVIAWWNGGSTSLDNCILLCGYHHRMYDSEDWTIRFSPTGIPQAIPPPWIDPQQTPRSHERFRERRGP